MAVTNDDIAGIFREFADLLEIEGDNPFRIRAYRRAATAISSLGKNVAELCGKNYDLTIIPGIGKDLAEKIKEIVETGELSLLKKTEKKLSPMLSGLMKLPGLGPKRVKILNDRFKVKNLNELKKLVDSGKLLGSFGFGEKTVEKLKHSIKNATEYAKKMKLADVMPVAERLLTYMRSCPAVELVEMAGSFRRRKEVVGDLDLVASASNASLAIKHFLSFDEVKEIVAQGKTRAAVKLKHGLAVDFRVVKDNAFGAVLLYFTGSKEHTIALRKRALKKKMKLNEYGLFDGQDVVASTSEAAIYKKMGLNYIEPELREDRGEIEAAISRELPILIEISDIRGDLHAHTKETDGLDSLEDMARAAQDCGYDYLAITDHSKHLAVANGLDERRLLRQIKNIDKLNGKLKNFTILKAIEVDILDSGKLDLSDDILKELDVRVCSIHSHFTLSLEKQTERIIRAMDNKYFNILGHPTGRLINQRPGYGLDFERIMAEAFLRGCFLELNAQPKRLDINDNYCRMAKEMGLKLAISTDSHNVLQFNMMKFGIFEARRGWLSKEDVINTRNLTELRKLLKR